MLYILDVDLRSTRIYIEIVLLLLERRDCFVLVDFNWYYNTTACLYLSVVDTHSYIGTSNTHTCACIIVIFYFYFSILYSFFMFYF